jgi:parallel beta-helix repeat protein
VPTAPVVSTEQGNQEAAVVAREDRRLVELRAVTSTSQMRSAGKSPYRVNAGSSYTLVLTPRTAPYTLSDLLALERQTLLLQPDGSYLLKEGIYVERGATLNLASPGGLTLKMMSDADGFVSIISYGGAIAIAGSASHPVTIESWNPQTQTTQTDLTNGRSYIRAIGGQLLMSYVNAQDLGFWSGDTGGIALTGTTRPSAGSTTYSGTVSKSKAGSLNSNQVTVTPLDGNSGDSSLFNVPGMSYVSAKIDHANISGDAFGLYFSTAQGVAISNSVVTGSLVEGIDLHRLTTEVEIQNVAANQNDGPGFDISRAAQQVQIFDCTADYNRGNGYTVNGQPISQGASASGEPLGSYGNNSITSSTAEGNAHYGIEVQGGVKITLQGNKIIGNQMGIVVTKATDTITIANNDLEQQDREGISLIDGVSKAAVTGNRIQGAATGIYVRGSVVELAGNTVGGASLHAITLIGPDAGSIVKDNTLGGAGVSAIDTTRSTGQITLGAENIGGWNDTTPLLKRIAAMIRPLTMIWLGIFIVLIVAAYRNWRTRTGKRKRHERRRAALAPGRHPYTNQLVLAVAPTMTLDEVLAESETSPKAARTAAGRPVARPAGPAAAAAPQWRPEPTGEPAQQEQERERGAGSAGRSGRARHAGPPATSSPVPAPAAASASASASVPASASAETAVLPAVQVAELAFPSFGDIAARRARAQTPSTGTPSAGDFDQRQW